VHLLAAASTSAKLDVSGGVAGRAYSSVFVRMSIMNRDSLNFRLY
jgi:hypothetical protein